MIVCSTPAINVWNPYDSRLRIIVGRISEGWAKIAVESNKMRGYNIRKSCTKGPIFRTNERFPRSSVWRQDDEIFGSFAHRMEFLLTAPSWERVPRLSRFLYASFLSSRCVIPAPRSIFHASVQDRRWTTPRTSCVTRKRWSSNQSRLSPPFFRDHGFSFSADRDFTDNTCWITRRFNRAKSYNCRKISQWKIGKRGNVLRKCLESLVESSAIVEVEILVFQRNIRLVRG